MQDKRIILFAGRHTDHPICGHSHYVRVHARAAVLAGYEPHIICIGPRPGVEETDYGIVHTSRIGTVGYDGQKWAPFHVQRLTHTVVDYVLGNPSVCVLYGFNIWGCVAARAAERLASLGRKAAPLVSVYNSYTDEHRNHLTVLSDLHGPIARLRQQFLNSWIERFVWRLERESISRTNLVMFNYRSVLKQLLGIDHNIPKWRLLPYTAELAFVNDTPLANGARSTAATRNGIPVITAVSRQVPKKGIDLLLHALARLKKAGVMFKAWIIGDGPFRQTHESLARQIGIAERVLFTGIVPDVGHYLRRSDIFVLPSLREESGSLALIEALFCGTAVIVSRVDGLTEDIEHRSNGLLVRPGDVTDLVAALSELLGNPELLNALRTRGRRLADSRFSIAKFSAALDRTYAEQLSPT